jgi:C-22 sterol desaturase
MEVVNTTFASPAANANIPAPTAGSVTGGMLSQAFNGVSGWTVALTIFLMLVAYDQCEKLPLYFQKLSY